MPEYAEKVAAFNTATIIGTAQEIAETAEAVKVAARAAGLANVMLCPSCGEVHAYKPAEERCPVCYHSGVIYEPVATFDNRPEYRP